MSLAWTNLLYRFFYSVEETVACGEERAFKLINITLIWYSHVPTLVSCNDMECMVFVKRMSRFLCIFLYKLFKCSWESGPSFAWKLALSQPFQAAASSIKDSQVSIIMSFASFQPCYNWIMEQGRACLRVTPGSGSASHSMLEKSWK